VMRYREQLRYSAPYLRDHPLAAIGLALVVLQLFLAVFGDRLVPYPPTTARPAEALQSPDISHWFGTDRSGMDIFSRCIAGARIDLFVGLSATALALVIGCPLGVVGGYYAGIISELLMRFFDFMISFPPLILALALLSVTGQNIANVIFVLTFVQLPVFARLVRSEVLTIKERDFVEAAKCAGAGGQQVMFHHLLPNSLTAAISQASVTVGLNILLVAGLSFVGAGVRVPTPEWGLMISTGAENMMTGQWWVAFFPGVTMIVTILGFGLIGDAIRDLLDPTQRR
jgi:peptide/nickel transport system permease protein